MAKTESMVALAGVPGVHGDHEYFVPLLGRGQRRNVQQGDHVPVGHELVSIWPDLFGPSQEPPDCWPVAVELEEVRRERERQRVRNDPALARLVTPCCRRCGAQAPSGVVIIDAPNAVDLISALSDLDDHDLVGRMQVERRFALLAQQARESTDQLAEAEQLWRLVHVECPEGTEPLPEPELPESAPLFRRLPAIRTLG
jgi:hypothetical protein